MYVLLLKHFLRLAVLFDLSDRDKSGSIDIQEVRWVLDQAPHMPKKWDFELLCFFIDQVQN